MRPLGLALEHRPSAVALLVLVTAWAGLGLTRLSFDDDYRAVFRSDSEEYRRLALWSEEFGREENDLVVLLESGSLLRAPALRRLYRLHLELERTRGVQSVYSLASLPRLSALSRRADLPDDALERAAAREAAGPLARGRLVSADRRVALLIVGLGSEALSLVQMEPVLAEAERIAAAHGATLTGIPALRRAAIRAIQREQLAFSLGAAALSTVCVLLIFRTALAPLLIGLGPALGVVWTLGAMGWAGERLNILNALVPQFVIAIGFSDAVHLLTHVRRRLGEGLDPREAARSAVRAVGVACWLTSATTAVGFGSLALARVELVQRFGLACAAGTLLSFVAVLTVVPLLCSTRLALLAGPSAKPRRAPRGPGWLRRARVLAFAHPAAVSLGATLALATLVLASLGLRPDYRYSENLPDDSPAAAAIARRDAVFGGSVPLLVRVGWPPGLGLDSPEVQATLREVAQVLRTEEPISGVTALSDLALAGGEDPGSLQELAARLPPALAARFLAADGRATLVAGLVPDLGSAELLPLLERLRRRLRLAAASPAVSVELGGLTALAAASSVLMIGDLARSLGSAAFVIFGGLMLALRSVRLGLVSLIPNLLPLAGATALLVALGLHLQYASVAVLTIGLGLAVDDTIHFLAAFRQAAQRAPAPVAARVALREVGAALCSTTLLLTSGLVTLGLSALPTIRLFGLLLCSLLGLALAADLLVLPALILSASGWRRPARTAAKAPVPKGARA